MLVSRPRSRLDTAVSYLSNLFWTEVAKSCRSRESILRMRIVERIYISGLECFTMMAQY